MIFISLVVVAILIILIFIFYIESYNSGYNRGKAEAQQKAEQLIYENYIPKQIVIDKIKEIKEDKDSEYYHKFLHVRDIENAIEILLELL